MLLINRNRPVSVESLINAVWGEEPVPAARTSIQVPTIEGMRGYSAACRAGWR